MTNSVASCYYLPTFGMIKAEKDRTVVSFCDSYFSCSFSNTDMKYQIHHT